MSSRTAKLLQLAQFAENDTENTTNKTATFVDLEDLADDEIIDYALEMENKLGEISESCELVVADEGNDSESNIFVIIMTTVNYSFLKAELHREKKNISDQNTF